MSRSSRWSKVWTRYSHSPRALAVLALLALPTLPILPALFEKPLAAQESFGPDVQTYGFGANKISYRKFKWHIYHSPHFNIYYYTGEESNLQKVVSFAESDYDDVSRFLNFQIKDPIPLIYFSSHSAFEQNNIILDFIPEGVGAFASPIRFRMVMPIDDPDGLMIAIMRHELTHIFQYKMLFQGSAARGVTSNLPTWFLEGMASYVGRDESVRDTMYLRDAVVNDIIPPITRVDIEGFFAYRFGHAVFAFIEDRWGHDGFLDFLYEIRNTIGARVDRAVKRAFKLDAEDFDAEFRRWLRKKYLPSLLTTGEPGDYGHQFRVKANQSTYETSPVASPSGDLVAAFSAYHGKVDVVLFDARKRTFIRNLTKPYSSRYQYLIAQELQIGRRLGRDLAFSPDGNTIAVFAKREKGRSLMLLDAINGGIRRIIDMDEIEQQEAPCFSPDGKKVAFSGTKDGKFDIFILDLTSDTITRLTDDDVFDGAPNFSPDGKSIVMVSVVGAGAHAKLFRMDLDKPGVRIPITAGETNENDPIYSPDGKLVYFTSDRGGRENIYSINLTNGEERQYTNVVSGAFMPAVLKQREGEEHLVFGGYWKMAFDIYETLTSEPVAKTRGLLESPELAALPPPPGAQTTPPAVPVGEQAAAVQSASPPASIGSSAGATAQAGATASASGAGLVAPPSVSGAAAGALPGSPAPGAAGGAGTSPASPASPSSPSTSSPLSTSSPSTAASQPLQGTTTAAAVGQQRSGSPGTEPVTGPPPSTGAQPGHTDLAKFEPDIQVTIDPTNESTYHHSKFFLEGAEAFAGVDTNNTYTGRILLTFSDQLGDRRIIADLSAVSTFSDFNLIYADLTNRLQWTVRAFDLRTFFIDQLSINGVVTRQQDLEETGAVATVIYPFSFYQRAELGAGYMIRKLNDTFIIEGTNGQAIPAILPSDDNFPVLTLALVGDTSQDFGAGPFTGERYRIDALYGPSVSGGGTIYDNLMIDLRKYFQTTLRSNFAFRLWGGASGGSRPNPFFLGGLDTIRGVDFRSLVGDRAFFANAEFRFPLVDLLATPILGFRGIRGNIFFDTGGAWFHNAEPFQFYSSKLGQLVDGVAAYGAGFSFGLLGLEANVDFAKVTNFKTTQHLATDFWIGTRF